MWFRYSLLIRKAVRVKNSSIELVSGKCLMLVLERVHEVFVDRKVVMNSRIKLVSENA